VPVISNVYNPPNGFNYKKVSDAATKANLVAALYGSNGAPSAFSFNNEQVVYRELHRRQVLQTVGVGGLTIRPTIDGSNNLVIPPQWASVAGRTFYLSGGDESSGNSDDDSIILPINTGSPTTFALLIEIFDSRVLPSTVTTPTQLPPGPSGVTSTANKRSGTTLYANGNLRRTIDSGVADVDLLSGTSIQQQEFVQTQYRVSLVTDIDLVGTTPSTGNTGVGTFTATTLGSPYYDQSTPLGQQAIVVATNADTTRAIDGQFFAAKLGLVRVVTAFGVPQLVFASDDLTGVTIVGQRPLPLTPRLSDLGRTITLANLVPGLVVNDAAQNTAISSLVARLNVTEPLAVNTQAALAAHIANPTGAHAASAIVTSITREAAVIDASSNLAVALNRINDAVLKLQEARAIQTFTSTVGAWTSSADYSGYAGYIRAATFTIPSAFLGKRCLISISPIWARSFQSGGADVRTLIVRTSQSLSADLKLITSLTMDDYQHSTTGFVPMQLGFAGDIAYDMPATSASLIVDLLSSGNSLDTPPNYTISVTLQVV
jgi:hypothetical protein